jgi:acyl-CoA thioester hydrolase
MGVAHHASYIPWLEIARTELLRTSGISYAQLEAAGVFLVVAKLSVAYRRPVRYDDVVRISCRVVGTSRVKIEHAYALSVIERDGRAVAEEVSIASTTLACVDAEGRVRTLPEWLMASEASSGDGWDGGGRGSAGGSVGSV